MENEFLSLQFLSADTVRKAHLVLSDENTYPAQFNFESLPALRVTVHVAVWNLLDIIPPTKQSEEFPVYTLGQHFESQLKAVASTNGGE